MNIENIKIANLKYDDNNARKHSGKNIKAIAGSLKEFGQQKPIVIDKNNIVIAGNGTLTAAIELGWNNIDAIRTKLEGDAAKAFAIADNRTSELASWDQDILKDQLFELKEINFDVESIGFNLKDFETQYVEGSKELDEKDFSDFDHTCPKCGFEFDEKS